MSMQGSDGGALRGYQKGEESLRHHLTKLIQREFRNVLSQDRALYVHTDDDEIILLAHNFQGREYKRHSVYLAEGVSQSQEEVIMESR